MTGDQIGQLFYLVLLALAISGYFIVQNRQRLGKVLQHATLWGLIFVGVIAAAGLWSDIRSTVTLRQAVFSEDGRIEVPRGPDGHFHLVATVNEVPVRFMVDTGATDIVLTRDDARRVGIDPDTLDFIGSADTANGTVRTAPVRLRHFEIGALADRDVRAWINGGEMDSSLLGMAYLQRFQKLEITRDRLVLTR